MRSRFVLSAATLAVMAASIASQVIPQDTSRVDVSAPVVLQEYFTSVGGVKHSEALFGMPTYGDTVTGKLIAPNATDGCSPIMPSQSWGSDFILLLPRGGGCSFETKVFNAQQAGASGALIGDTSLLCGDRNAAICNSLCSDYCGYRNVIPPTVPNPNNCECILPYMGDDGIHNVHIPSFLISNNAYTNFLACMNGQAPCSATESIVTVGLYWPLPAPDNRVEYSIWSSPIDEITDNVREGFKPLVPYLGSTVQFTGRSFVYDGQMWGCTQPYLPCGNQCVNQGYYCAPDPDGPDGLLTGHSGADVVMEELRQICIFQQANASVATDNAIKYWNYVNLWYNQCMDVEDWVSCSASQQIASGLDPNWTLNCMVQSNNTGNYTNTLLQQELRMREDYLILTLPTFVVNEVVMRGQPTPHLLFNSICNGFANKAPTVCECTGVSDDMLLKCAQEGINNIPVANGGRLQPSSKGLPGWGVALIVILVLAVVGGAIGGVIAYRRQKKTMVEMLEDYRRLEAEEATLEDNRL